MGKYSNWNLKSRDFWKEGWGSLFLAVLAAFTIRWALIEAYVIPSGSMLPSLQIHDHIFVNKLAYGIRFPFSETWMAQWAQPQRGDVIVFKFPLDMSTNFVKRTIGLPGDKIYYERGTLYVNDKPMEKKAPVTDIDYKWLRDADFNGEGRYKDAKDNYVHFTEQLESKDHDILLRKGQGNETFGPVIVPEDQLFMMGDNRDNSRDGREWGFLPRSYILGKASFVWLSCEETLPILSMVCNPLTIRWGRFFRGVN